MKKLVLSVLTFFSVAVPFVFSQTTGTHNGHEWVDLGLSVKWATRNVGAYSDLSAGDEFYYGETKVKSRANPNKMTAVSLESIAGNKSYDAAAAIWGGSWRMPTWQNFRELIDCCTWTYYQAEERYFIKATSKVNGMCISFPLPDYKSKENGYYVDRYYGEYWSSTFDGNDSGCSRFYKDFWDVGAFLKWIDFSTACMIRPVLD